VETWRPCLVTLSSAWGIVAAGAGPLPARTALGAIRLPQKVALLIALLRLAISFDWS
jgi:hypothetical protein